VLAIQRKTGEVLAKSIYSAQSEHPEYWYNLKTGQVEIGPQSASRNRVGPFSSREEAADALLKIRARSEAWRESEKED